MFEKMQNEKSLLELTHLLVEKDYSWMTSREDDVRRDDDRNHTPLLIAARNGISEIVKKMLELHPQSVEAHDIDEQQNILHVAIMHRWLEIFKLIKKSKSITSRMAMKIDNNGNTILHQAATMRYYSADTQRLGGPALQLQDELRWMARVKKIISPRYIMKHNREEKTAEQLFNSEHAKLLQSAQTWIKETAQSCSTVAALVATVVYAAAYTAPGGNDSNGVPVLRHSSFFFTFAVADTVSPISSLASLVTFLSILTSPLEYQDFYRSLPFRLRLGFTLLFCSLITTMLTFTATILLLIHPQKKWTTSLIFVVSFLPVPVCGLMQLPLFKGFSQGLKYILKKITKIKTSIFSPAVTVYLATFATVYLDIVDAAYLATAIVPSITMPNIDDLISSLASSCTSPTTTHTFIVTVHIESSTHLLMGFKLNGSNYEIWASMIELHAITQGKLGYLIGDIDASDSHDP
ncbi:protein ACCELERATED CELL DEATH 6-like [Prunus avium]|uniref:Protein ACCELERATED CELL DEATH 6-like n=1 Tax=Prunus avium TaxID=42229 RepID=A0A6P5RNY7_PRUAV|nr:protein ACCELERATED CELL DEATH 6-like [Prunus avium]